MTAATLLSIQVGQVAPLGPEGVPSGFVKSTVKGAVGVNLLGLAGDEQADLSVHGGPEKAVYAYPASHYEDWAMDFPRHAGLFVAGGVGENLTIAGLTEADLCVGDVHRIGSALLQVCQPRQPCSKFALRFNDKSLPKAMVRNGRAGWYYRVVEEGSICAGKPVSLEHRPNPCFDFERLVQIVNFGDASSAELSELAAMDGLASGLKARAAAALKRA